MLPKNLQTHHSSAPASHGTGGEVREAERAELAPRELPPWLQRKDQAPIASTSYSVSQEMSEDTKDFTDIKSLGPEDSKAAVEVCFSAEASDSPQAITGCHVIIFV